MVIGSSPLTSLQPLPLLVCMLTLSSVPYVEKEAPVRPATASASGPPATLLSLPVELLTMVIDELRSSYQWRLCAVCFRLLEAVSATLVHHLHNMDSETALRYVLPRVREDVLLPSESSRAGCSPSVCAEAACSHRLGSSWLPP